MSEDKLYHISTFVKRAPNDAEKAWAVKQKMLGHHGIEDETDPWRYYHTCKFSNGSEGLGFVCRNCNGAILQCRKDTPCRN